jgi:hypothetical protein
VVVERYMIIAMEQVFAAEYGDHLAGILVLSETNDGFLIDNVAVLLVRTYSWPST